MSTVTPKKFQPGTTGSISDAINSVVSGAMSSPAAEQALSEPAAKILREDAQKRRLALLRIASPIVGAVIHDPGMNPRNKDKVVALMSSMIDYAIDEARALLASSFADIGGRGWVKSQVFELVISHVAEEWRNNGKALQAGDFAAVMDVVTKNENKRALDWLEKSGNTTPIRNENDAASRIRLSVIKSIGDLHSSISQFSFWGEKLNPEAKVSLEKSMVEKIGEIVAEEANVFSDSRGLSGESRVMLWQSLINRVFHIANEEYLLLSKEVLRSVGETAEPSARARLRKEWAGRMNHVADLVADRTRTSMKTLMMISNAFVDVVVDSEDNGFSEDVAMGSGEKMR